MNDEIRSVILNIRVRPSLKAGIERLAAAEHRSLSNWIELLLEKAVTAQEPTPDAGKPKRSR